MAKRKKAKKAKKGVATPKRTRKGAATKKRISSPKKARKIASKTRVVAAGGPPGGILYKCDPSGPPGSGQCLRFNWNPKSQNWDWPPEGIPMACSDCKWFF
jgi:hypothetical protein